MQILSRESEIQTLPRLLGDELTVESPVDECKDVEEHELYTAA